MESPQEYTKKDTTNGLNVAVMMPVMLPPTAPPRASVGARDPLGVHSGAGWRRRIRLSLEAQRLRDLHMRPHDLSLFSGNQIHLIRVDGRLLGGWPTPRWEWVPAMRPGSALEGSRHIGSHLSRMEPIPGFELRPAFPTPATPDLHVRGSSGSSGPGPGTSTGASGVVGAGAAVLALAVLVLLARALEQCLDRRLFKLLRRRSDEWYSPNVLATSQGPNDSESAELPGLESPNIPPGDPPPPYSMCLPKNPRSPEGAEPPPPYSACYVAFGGPQDPQPRVHLNMPTLNRFQDTGQAIETDGTNSRNCTVIVSVEPPEYSQVTRNEDSERNPTDPSSSTANTALGAAASPNNLVA